MHFQDTHACVYVLETHDAAFDVFILDSHACCAKHFISFLSLAESYIVKIQPRFFV